uniref:Uncharacterized protein n=1 Tax=Chrysolophus pictus TaxID=9089 RepID=A0A8C3L8D3_CHRPC
MTSSLQCPNIIQHQGGLVLVLAEIWGSLGHQEPCCQPSPAFAEAVGPLITSPGLGASRYPPSLCHSCCASPEATKQTLLEDLKTAMVARSRVLELEEEVQLLTSQRDSLGQELSAVTTQLEKEKAKVESTLRHEKSLQAKQNTLLQQLDSLDREREELQASLGEAEEDRAQMAEQLQESQKQKEQSMHQLRVQQELLNTLQQEKLSLEQSISKLRENVSGLEEQTKELKEREKLLVFFPELHIPVETQFESTGNITEDMEKQLQANHIRIGVLEQENTRLRAALAKVKAAAQQGVLQVSWGGWQDGVHCVPQGHPANPVPQPLGIGSLAVPIQEVKKKDFQERKAVVLLVQHCLWLWICFSWTKPSSLVLWCLSRDRSG